MVTTGNQYKWLAGWWPNLKQMFGMGYKVFTKFNLRSLMAHQRKSQPELISNKRSVDRQTEKKACPKKKNALGKGNKQGPTVNLTSEASRAGVLGMQNLRSNFRSLRPP